MRLAPGSGLSRPLGCLLCTEGAFYCARLCVCLSLDRTREARLTKLVVCVVCVSGRTVSAACREESYMG